MSRLDFLTIAIVTVCIIALGYLVYKTIGLMGNETPTPTERVETPATNAGEEAEAGFDDEGELISDNENESGESEEGDLDDEQLTDENTLNEEEEAIVDEAELSSDDPIEEEEPTPTNFEENASSNLGAYLVLAGSYRLKVNAENQVRKLKRLGYDDAEVTIFNRGAYASVLVARFDSRSDAQDLAKELESKHSIDAIVQKKKGSR